MKNSLLLFVISLCFLLSGLNAKAQQNPIGPIIITDQWGGVNKQEGIKEVYRQLKSPNYQFYQFFEDSAKRKWEESMTERSRFYHDSIRANAKAHAGTIQGGHSFFKDSAQYKAFKSQMDLTKSFAKNLQLGIIDSSQIKELKALAKANAKIFSLNLKDWPSSRTSVGLIGSQEGEGDLSQLSLKKSFKGESLETIKKFSVTENSKMLRLNITGKVESGTITITLTKPNGSKFKSIEIDPSSDITFEQTLLLKKNPADWIGDWQIKVHSDKANGDYRLNILTR